MHPQTKAFLDALAEQQAPGWEEMSPTEGREVFSSLTDLFGSGVEVFRVEDRAVGDDVAIRIYWPSESGPLPAVLYMHGGGWVLGNLDTHDALCRRLAYQSESIVVSVDYRRSPETKFPGAAEDCYAALQYAAEHAGDLRIEPDKIVVAGDSAGGNLATTVAAMACQRQGPRILQQVLIYPVLDHRCDSDSYREFAAGFGLTETAMKWFWRQYLEQENDGNDDLASPLLARDLRGLPPTHVVTAEYDVLRDEGEQYVKRLQEAGVPTTHRRYDGVLHGFVHFSGVFDVGLEAIGEIADVIRSACSGVSPKES